MPQQTPWWVPWLLIGFLVVGGLVLVVAGKLTPSDWLTYSLALGVQPPRPSVSAQPQVGNVEGDVTVEGKAK